MVNAHYAQCTEHALPKSGVTNQMMNLVKKPRCEVVDMCRHLRTRWIKRINQHPCMKNVSCVRAKRGPASIESQHVQTHM